MAGDVDVGNIHLPEIVRLLRQDLEEPRGLICLGRSLAGLLKQSMIPHDNVRLSVLHGVAGATAHYRNPLVAIPGILSRHRHHGLDHLLGNRLWWRTRTFPQTLVR